MPRTEPLPEPLPGSRRGAFEAFGCFLEAERERLGFTWTALANGLQIERTERGVDDGLLRRWRAGREPFPKERLDALIVALATFSREAEPAQAWSPSHADAVRRAWHEAMANHTLAKESRAAQRRSSGPASPPAPAPAATAPVSPAADGKYGRRAVDLDAITGFAREQLVGRDPQRRLLDSAWRAAADDRPVRPRVLVFHALGGEGKTSLVASWAVDAANKVSGVDVPMAFAWSFYKQGTGDQRGSSSYEFLNAAAKHFGIDDDNQAPRTDMARAESLAKLLSTRPALLILDGLEPLQFSPGPSMDARLKDDALAHLLLSLARANRGLCVVTTRYAIANLASMSPSKARQHPLQALSPTHSVQLLRLFRLGVAPNEYRITGTDEEFEALALWTRGHALTLNLMGQYLLLAHQGYLGQQDLVTLRRADAKVELETGRRGHAWRVLKAYVRWFERSETKDGAKCLAMLMALGLFDRPASVPCLRALFAVPEISGLTTLLLGADTIAIDITCKQLEAIGMVTCQRASEAGRRLLAVDAHPLVREYFADYVKSELPQTWAGAQARLFEHLAGATVGSVPTEPAALEPLYQAVVHGCHAGLHQRAFDEVFWKQICRGAVQFSTSKFGALNSDLASLAGFFDEIWTTPAGRLAAETRMKVASLAGFRLRSAGRFDESEPLMVQALAYYESKRDWDSAAKEAGNLSVLYMHAGRLRESLVVAERAVRFAEVLLQNASALANKRRASAMGDRGARKVSREEVEAKSLLSNRLATLGDPLIQMGPAVLERAVQIFQMAERIQAETHPERPLLHSTKGYRYHELLLDLGRSDEVIQRLDVIAPWTTADYALLDQGQMALVRGRAHLIRAKALGATSDREAAAHFIQRSLEHLRQANYQESVVRALLLKVELEADTDGLSQSVVDALNDAWQSAARGPLRLFQADVLLARLRAHWEAPGRARKRRYPWGSAARDFDEVRQMIETMGYGRRLEEVRRLARRAT